MNELNHLLQVNTDCLLSLCSLCENLRFHFSSVSIWCLEGGDMYTAVQGLYIVNMDALLL